ncbi:MAG: amidohydrolase family protein [Acidobacteriaceae bacterium]|nr:amidohydrolase family protein [Acidobacteriaceae bacterium]
MRFLIWALIGSLPLLAGNDDTFLIRGATVHPVSSPEIQNGSILVRDGKIVGVGRNLSAPKGVKVIEAKGMHVYPGMIDSATQIGLSEISAVRETVDVGELGEFNPQLRAEIAINPSSEHIPVVRANGITTVIALPMSEGRGGGMGRGAAPQPPIITGQAALVHLDGWTWEEMDVKKSAAMAMDFPTIAASAGRFSDEMTSVPRGPSFADRTRQYETQMRELREFFEEARRYQTAKSSGTPLKPDLKFEAMLPVLEGKMPMMIVATRERAIRDAVKFSEDEKVKIVIADPKELGSMGPVLKEKGIPVILGATLALPLKEDDPYDAAFTLPGEFYKAGVKFAFGTFNNQFSRNLPYQAATAVAFGLPYEEALKAVTLNAAEIWGVADRVGSIEEGKWADLMMTDGDPLETKTQVKQLFIKGKNVDLENKHHRLYEKYMNRP